jgi:hypothetical protein
VGKPEGKRPFGRHRIRCVDNIKRDLKRKVWGLDCIDLAHDRSKDGCFEHSEEILHSIK